MSDQSTTDNAHVQDRFVPIPASTSFKNLSGLRFGRLLVLGYVGLTNKRSTWLCLCDCGTERKVAGSSLGNNTKSCGCLAREELAERNRRKNGPPLKSHPEYWIWDSMRRRCLNPQDASYPGYGGRGIGVCPSWAKSFEAFLADMGKRPSSSLTLERIDNDGNYEPGNCRWATRAEQSRNRRNNVFLEHNGRRMIAADWAKETGLSKSCIERRVRRGMSVAEALTRPSGFKKRKS
jgi:hypothetical protein